MFNDNEIRAVEKIVGGKVYSLFYDPMKLKYDVGFEKDNRLQQKEISKELVEDVMAGRTDLDGLRKD
jgi:hypothetical protein